NLRYWVENTDGTVPAGTEDGFDISEGGLGLDRVNDYWVPAGLPSHAFDVWVQTAKRNRQKILFEPGDLFLMQLGKDLRFRPFVVSKEGYHTRSYVESDPSKTEGWRMAILQNQKVGDRELQMLATLERLTDREAETLHQVKPRDVWFEIQPQGNSRGPFGVRWKYDYGYPAAA